MRDAFRLTLAAWFLLAAGAEGDARKSADNIALTPASKTGALLIRVAPRPFDYQLTFQKEGSGGFGSRVYVVDIDPDPRKETWEVRTLSPGRYVLKYVMQQNGWIGCLEDGTILLEIKPGVVNYLGAIEAGATLTAIQAAALESGEVTAGGGQGGGIYHDVPPPTLEARAEPDLVEARRFVAAEMVKTRATVDLATVEPHRFRSADDRNRRKRACN